MSKTTNQLKSECRKFGENVSIRGVPKVLKTKDVVLKVVWFVSLLVSTGILLWQLSLLFMKYVSFPVSTTFGEEVKGSVVFPDISICSLYPLSLSRKEKIDYSTYFDTTIRDMLDDDKWRDEPDDEINFGLSLKDTVFYTLASPSSYFSNLIKKSNKDTSCPPLISECKLFRNDWNAMDADCTITPFWNAKYYRCFTVSVADKLMDSVKGISMAIYLDNTYKDLLEYSPDLTDLKSRAVRISVHPRKSLPDFKRGVSAGVGTETTFKITQTTRTRLSKPYSTYDCTKQKFLPYGDGKEVYTPDECVETCYQQLVLEKCGCLFPGFLISAKQIEQFDVCGNRSCEAVPGEYFYKCDQTGIDNLKEAFKYAFRSTENFTELCDKKCLPPCKQIIYDLSSVTASWPHPSYELKIYKKYVENCTADEEILDEFETFSRVSEKDPFNYSSNYSVVDAISELRGETAVRDSFLEVHFVIENAKPNFLLDKPFYTWDTMIGLVGGCLSLWLGITVMTGVEFIEFIYILSTSCRKRKNPDINM